MYYALAPLALFALWRWRERKDLVYPLIAIAIAACLTFTLIAGTRYRAPLEPMIAILACSLLAPRPPSPQPRAPAS
jgi:hypothetical protein